MSKFMQNKLTYTIIWKFGYAATTLHKNSTCYEIFTFPSLLNFQVSAQQILGCREGEVLTGVVLEPSSATHDWLVAKKILVEWHEHCPSVKKKIRLTMQSGSFPGDCCNISQKKVMFRRVHVKEDESTGLRKKKFLSYVTLTLALRHASSFSMPR